MPVSTSGIGDVEITGVDGTVVGFSLVAVADDNGNDQLRGHPSSLNAANADSPLSEWLEPEIQESFKRGVGLDYRQAPGMYTRAGGGDDASDYAIPAGYATDVTVTATNNSTTSIRAIEEFGGDVWFAQTGDLTANKARVMRATGGAPPLANSLNVASTTETITDLLVFGDGAGTQVLWAAGNDLALPGGTLRKWNGAAWSVPGVGTGQFPNYRRDWIVKVRWTTNDGVGGWRMIAGSGDNKISYTLPNADPLLPASWVEGVEVQTVGRVLKPAVARTHVWVPAVDGLFDLTADGENPNLLDYGAQMLHPFNGTACRYLDGYVYMSRGQGLERVFVDGDRQLQENVGQCAPGWGTAAEHEYRGWASCITSDQGYIVPAVYNPSTKQTGIFWGKDRRILGIDSPNPVIWYGPEIHSVSDVYVTAMRPVAAGTLGTGMRLWIAASAYTSTVAPYLAYVSLPVAGAPLDDLISGGEHRFATGQASGSTIWQTFSRIQSMPLVWKDTNASKFVHEVSLATRGLDSASATTMTAYLRADPPVGSTSYSGPQVITQAMQPATPYTPDDTTAGKRIDWRVDFFSPQGGAALAADVKVGVLDAVRITAFRRAPAFRVVTLTLEYGDDVAGKYGEQDEATSPDQKTTHLYNLTLGGRTTYRDPIGKRYSFILRQVLDVDEVLTEGTYGKRCTARVVGALLAAV